ncbi:mannonate dehydratase [Alteribacillus sp. HJP-4]|uniref:mannonate dehydratase n=1 Tax=Alteribacillus sp. HJP-4 TaxID=2775394 RepID=UPI0035CCFD34
MKFTLRWFGEEDPVSLAYIKQIPGVTGIVSAVYDIPVGEVWPQEKIRQLRKEIESHNLSLEVIESVPVHEDIKLGKREASSYVENYKQTLRNLAAEGIETVCYNFMPVFDWTRSQLDFVLPDDSTALIYDHEHITSVDPLSGELTLPGWDASYENNELKEVIDEFKLLTEEDMWKNINSFLQEVIPVAEEVGINMAIHPDDPPWSIFGLPRIITNQENVQRFLNLYDSPNNGLTLCSGSYGALPANDIPQMIRTFGSQGKIHFAHCRNIKRTKNKSFEESSHLSSDGSLDMVEIMKAYDETGFTGPIRPDHGRMIWGETGRPGYGLYDRALGASYLRGIWETLQKTK